MKMLEMMKAADAALLNDLQITVKRLTIEYPDFPEKGILFKDLTPLFADPKSLSKVCQWMLSHNLWCDKVIGLESRGFLLSTLVSHLSGRPQILARKAGKLPGELYSYSYSLEYGKPQTLQMQKNVIQSSERVMVVDDVLATGNTAAASAELIHQAGGEVVSFCFINEIKGLGGRELLEKIAPVHSIVTQ